MLGGGGEKKGGLCGEIKRSDGRKKKKLQVCRWKKKIWPGEGSFYRGKKSIGGKNTILIGGGTLKEKRAPVGGKGDAGGWGFFNGKEGKVWGGMGGMARIAKKKNEFHKIWGGGEKGVYI